MNFVKPKDPSVMPPSHSERSGELRSLTGLRGIAALNVALAHFELPAFSSVNELFSWYNQAVDLFFCLSGFTLALVCERREQSFANWRSLCRRAIRPHISALSRHAAVGRARQISGGIAISGRARLERNFLAQLALVNCWPVIGTGVHWNIPAWSISVEFFCYLAIFPLLGVFDRPRRAMSPWRSCSPAR